MKVLHLSSEKGWRGGEQQIAYLIKELTKLGLENYVAVRKGSSFETFCIKNHIPIFSLPFVNSLDIRTALAIKKVSQQNGISIIHMHNPNSHSVGVLSAFLGNKVPLILSRRVDFVPKKSWFTKWKYNHPSIKRILCVSDKINTIMRAYLNNPDKSVTVHSGVDLDKFNNDKFNNATNNKLRSEFNISSDFWIIGNSSALEAHKDYYTFIRTIGVLVSKKLPIHSFIIGTGSQEASLKAYVAELALEQHITFTGFRNDIVDILPSLDIFLMTSSEEGLGTSVLDAFLSKAVVVATRAGGIPEMVVHEQSGLLAAVGDSEALASEVERVIKSPQLKDQLILGALNKVKDFSKEATAANTLTIYTEVLSEQQL